MDTLQQVPHLLLVDDDNDLVDLLGERLREEGYQVSTAGTGADGLRVLHAGPLPDAVILDIEMPVMGGPAMAHQMLLHDAGEEKIPILLMSSREDLPEIAARMGTKYFLAKTGDVELILRTLLRVLRERAAPLSA